MSTVMTVVFFFWFSIVGRTSYFVLSRSDEGWVRTAAIFGVGGALIGLAGSIERAAHLSLADDFIVIATLLVMAGGISIIISFLSGRGAPVDDVQPATQTIGGAS